MVCKRILGIALAGLFSVFVVYPVLHELGHFIVAKCFGVAYVQWNLLGAPFVLCQTPLSSKAVGAIALGGLLFPWIGFLVPCRRFWWWLVGWFVRWVCVLSVGISGVGLFWFSHTSIWQQEDIAKVIRGFGGSSWIWFVGLWLWFFVGVYTLMRNGWEERIFRYLLAPQTKSIVNCRKQMKKR